MKKTLLCSALLAALMCVSGGAQAALVSQGNGVVLDNVNNLLWYADGGQRNFASATSWAAGLTTGGLLAGSWGLSNDIQFSQLAAAAGYVASDNQTKQYAAGYLNYLGINGQTFGFWSTATRYGLQGTNNSGIYPYGESTIFEVSIGQGGTYVDNSNVYSLAVAQYSAPSAVPIPAAAWLMASGLGALGVSARKRKARQA
jgi:hypothetical protein